MANSLVTPTWYTKEVARILVNNLKFASNVNRTYDDAYVQSGAKVGYTVNARMPQRYQVTEGQALQTQALNDQYVPITLTHQKNIAYSWSTASMTQEIDSVRDRYVKPAAAALANVIDYDGLNTLFKDVYQSVGTPGTTPSTNLTYLQAGAKLTDSAAPTDGRVAVLDPTSMVTLANANLALFNPSAQISEQYREGQFASRALGVSEWYEDANVSKYTTGTYTASTPLVNGASQTGSTLVTNGWASGAATLNKGDIFTLAGVYGVNPVSYASTGQLQQFVVTTTTTSVGVNMATLPISPSIITSGQLQTVTASPADDAVITVLGTTNPAGGTLAATVSSQSLVYHPDAFALVMSDLHRPTSGAEATVVRSKELGISIRMVQQYQIGTDSEPTRLDILYGWATLRPTLACRVQG
jgi:hypothetical protein|tara:strand:+ start:2007 stop:3245 length:1239 start_codon:yes stop_codon:yes gene_type:complete